LYVDTITSSNADRYTPAREGGRYVDEEDLTLVGADTRAAREQIMRRSTSDVPSEPQLKLPKSRRRARNLRLPPRARTVRTRFLIPDTSLVMAGARPSSNFRFLRIEMRLPPEARRLCVESREIPAESEHTRQPSRSFSSLTHQYASATKQASNQHQRAATAATSRYTRDMATRDLTAAVWPLPCTDRYRHHTQQASE